MKCPICTEHYEGRLAHHLQDKHTGEQVAKCITDLLNYEMPRM